MKRGVDALANAVATTLGPKGRNVALDKKFGAPTVTHDGVTVAKEIELKDPYENMGAQLLKEAATKTNDVAGDGTTTATVLAQAIVHEGLKNVTAGANPMQIKRGLEMATDAVVNAIKKMATPVEDKHEIANVAAISAADQEIGDLIAEVMDKVGKDGVVTVEESKGREFETEYVEGMQFDRGYISAYFVTNPEAMEAVIERSVYPDPRQEDQRGDRYCAVAGEAAPDGQARSGHHCGRCGRRSAGDAGAEQAARHVQHAGREGPRFRRSPQGHAARHCHPDRRHRHHRRTGPQAGERDAGRSGPAPPRSWPTRTTPRSSKARAS